MSELNLVEDVKNILNQHDMTGEASELYAGFRELAQTIIAPLDDQIDLHTKEFPHELWSQLGESGMKGIIVPKEYGGLGLGYMHLAAATLEISKASGSVGLSYLADQALCTHQIIKHGTEEQKNKYLEKLANGTFVGALAMSESKAGSDVMSMTTRAEKTVNKDGVAGYKINGKKMWITNGGRETAAGNKEADVLVVYAETQKNPKRLTAFLVDGDTPGFEAYSKIKKEGLRGSETWELSFEDCFVPESAVLGEVDKGAHVLMAGLNAERLILGAGALGLAQAALEEAIHYTTHERDQFGKPISYNQAVAHDLADMYSELMAATNHMFMAAAMADRNIDTLSNAVAASVFLEASKTATKLAEQNVYYHGGNGQTIDFRAGRIKRDASLYRVGGGSEAVRLIRIAEEIISGYREHMKHQTNITDIFNNGIDISADELEALMNIKPELAKKLQAGHTVAVNAPQLD